MPRTTGNERGNQRRRTRKDLLAAAGRLLKGGRTPDMDEVAAEAMVSRATAYRYFPSIDSLLVEAPLDEAVPDAATLFEGGGGDPAERLDRAEAALHDMCYRWEKPLRAMLAASVTRPAARDVPVRQNRRSALIDAALAPARSRLRPAEYRRLCAALALVFGTESMIVFSDVVGLDEGGARRVKRWMIRALVDAAFARRG
jgi:AcrR family transcriptional regulator